MARLALTALEKLNREMTYGRQNVAVFHFCSFEFRCVAFGCVAFRCVSFLCPAYWDVTLLCVALLGVASSAAIKKVIHWAIPLKQLINLCHKHSCPTNSLVSPKRGAGARLGIGMLKIWPDSVFKDMTESSQGPNTSTKLKNTYLNDNENPSQIEAFHTDWNDKWPLGYDF